MITAAKTMRITDIVTGIIISPPLDGPLDWSTSKYHASRIAHVFTPTKWAYCSNFQQALWIPLDDFEIRHNT